MEKHGTKTVFKYIGIILSFILPVMVAISMAGVTELNPYEWLWCGLYGPILVWAFSRSKILKAVVTIINLAIFLLLGFAFFMGGLAGFGLFLRFVFIPFYSVWF